MPLRQRIQLRSRRYTTAISVALFLLLSFAILDQKAVVAVNRSEIVLMRAFVCLFSASPSIRCNDAMYREITSIAENDEIDNSIRIQADLLSGIEVKGDRNPMTSDTIFRARMEIQRYTKLGDRYSTLGDLGRAERVYRAITILYPRDAKSYYQLGQFLRSQNRFSDAQTAIEQGIAVGPENAASGLLLKGFTFFSEGNWEDAISSFNQANQRFQTEGGLTYSEPSQLHYFWGEALRRLGKLDESSFEFLTAIEFDPERRWSWPTYAAYVGLGDIYLTKQDYTSAEAAYGTALNIADNDAQRIVVTQRISSMQTK